MATAKRLRVLVVDDEEAARYRLEELLGREADVEIVAQVDNGREAVRAITSLRPDLVFLDVQMPGLTGVEVVQQVGPEWMPVVIFVTAYDRYALKAFDLAALDYLLKPFDDERFEHALARARDALSRRALYGLQDRLARLLRSVPRELVPTTSRSRYLERIAVDQHGQVRLVAVERIDFLTAHGSHVRLHVGEDAFVVREPLEVLEERLDPERFVRIHRGTIVQIDRIETVLFSTGGDHGVRLQDGRHLKLDRSRWQALSGRLGIQGSRQRDESA